MQEIFFLLLPVAAFYGWYMGVRSVYQKKQKDKNKFNRDYLTGLNFLFSDQPDKAVDHFIALLEVDDDTIETHLALGNLFRQRGEVDRAIRIHQNLIARPSLTREQRDLALWQLGKDFYQSGLFDRSEDVFLQLKESPEYKVVALENLLNIYQQLQDWTEAVAIAEMLHKISKKGASKQTQGTTLAYLYARLAEELDETTQAKEKRKLYEKSLSISPKCIKAQIALSRNAKSAGDNAKALQILEKVPDIDIAFTELVLNDLWELHKTLKTEETFLTYLSRIVMAGAGASAVVMLSKLIEKYHGADKARAFILQELDKKPTMRGFAQLMTYQLQETEGSSESKSLLFLQKLIIKQIKLRPRYRCQKCGYATNRFYWLCPSCKNWGRIKPIRGLDGE